MGKKEKKDYSLVVGAGILIVYLLIAFIGPLVVDGANEDLMNALKAPGAGYLFGTDELGRNLMGRVLHASRIDLMIAVCGVSLAYLLALPFGLFGRKGGPGDIGGIGIYPDVSIYGAVHLCCNYFWLQLFGAGTDDCRDTGSAVDSLYSWICYAG